MRSKRNHFNKTDKAIIRYLDLCFEYHSIIDRLNTLMIERLQSGIEGKLISATELFNITEKGEEE